MKSDVIIRNIQEQEYTILDANGVELVTTRNPLILYDVRIQIIDKQLEGYSVLFNGNIYPIKLNSRIDNWPIGLCDMYRNLLAEILKKGAKVKI